jgi:midasin
MIPEVVNARLGLFVILFPGLPELTSSKLDEKLMPEHLLRVCLEYPRTCAAALDSNSYNAYKVSGCASCTLIPSCSFLYSLLLAYLQDPNPPVLFKMVEPLTALQENIRSFLDDWPDHPGLLKILEIIASLLALPLSTPVSKVWYPINWSYNITTNFLLNTNLSCLTVTLLLKALLGLQLLAGKAQTLQENDSKFFLKGKAESSTTCTVGR